MAKLISLDIDGTLELGDPPGIIPVSFVRRLLEQGYIVGSCSDNTVRFQRQLWEAQGIAPHFAVLKQELGGVRAQFVADAYVHVGDRVTDRLAAKMGGFEFIDVATLVGESGDFLESLLLLPEQ